MELLFALLICAIVGLLVLNPFKKGALGFLLGLLLGPLGVIIAIIERSNLRREELNGQHREVLTMLQRGTSAPEPEMPWDQGR